MALHLYVSCRNLPILDILSKSDPMAVLQANVDDKWVEVDRTESLKNSCDPDFTHPFKVEYFFEELQYFRITIYDVDSSSADLLSHDVIGDHEFLLGDLLTAKGQSLRMMLRGKKCSGDASVTIRGEELSETNDSVIFRLSGSDLDKKDFFGKSDPFYVLFRQLNDNSLVQVFQSETIMKDLNPRFQQQQLHLQKLCNNNYDNPIVIKVFDFDKHSSPDLIGEASFTLQQVIDTPGTRLDLINPAKVGNRKYLNSGTIRFEHVSILKEPNLLQFIKGGCQIRLMIAIDFTGSNGNPAEKGTLHYRDRHSRNQYEEAILSVGNILAPYDSDQSFPVWGFGARPNSNAPVSHCFPLNFGHENPEVKGIENVLKVYDKAFDRIVLSGPTYMAEIIQAACHQAKTVFSQENQHYNVLLMLTDGEIVDVDATIESIVNATFLPLSIIIVGIGNADFSTMQVLDGDNSVLRSKGREAKRDIVQFVEMRKCSNGKALASQVLGELPSQFLEFMKDQKIKPNNVSQ